MGGACLADGLVLIRNRFRFEQPVARAQLLVLEDHLPAVAGARVDHQRPQQVDSAAGEVRLDRHDGQHAQVGGVAHLLAQGRGQLHLHLVVGEEQEGVADQEGQVAIIEAVQPGQGRDALVGMHEVARHVGKAHHPLGEADHLPLIVLDLAEPLAVKLHGSLVNQASVCPCNEALLPCIYLRQYTVFIGKPGGFCNEMRGGS